MIAEQDEGALRKCGMHRCPCGRWFFPESLCALRCSTCEPEGTPCMMCRAAHPRSVSCFAARMERERGEGERST